MQTVNDTGTSAKLSGTGLASYTAELTAAQIFGFADLVRRLGQAYGPDASTVPCARTWFDALNSFVCLLPEPPEEDGDAYLAAVRAGQLPDWGMDDQPLTETPEERAATVRARLAAQGQDAPPDAALTREEAAYAHLASFTGGERIVIGGRRHVLCDEAVVEYPQACPGDSGALADACLVAAVTGGARVQISVADLLSGSRHIEHDSRRQWDGEQTWFDEAGFAARVGVPRPTAVTARSFPGIPESSARPGRGPRGTSPAPRPRPTPR